jgi:hypothetical protein
MWDRAVLGISKHGNFANRLGESMGDLPAKDACVGRPSRFGPTFGSADPKWRLPSTAFIWLAGRWALMLILGG